MFSFTFATNFELTKLDTHRRLFLCTSRQVSTDIADETSWTPHADMAECILLTLLIKHLLLIEQMRLGLTADVPLVSQQWNAIIAGKTRVSGAVNGTHAFKALC